MSEQKHTPGPWYLSGEWPHDGLASEVVHAPPEGVLAIVRCEHQGRYYGNANARLIAAAPDLLEALKSAERVLDVHGYREWIGGSLDGIRAAIAKATPATPTRIRRASQAGA